MNWPNGHLTRSVPENGERPKVCVRDVLVGIKSGHPENPKTKSVIISAEMTPPTGVIPNGAQAAKRAKRS